MSEINYAAMSDEALREYFLKHRDDESAFQAYLERRRSHPRQVITKVGDPDFDLKIERAIEQKLQARKHSNS
ncbi:DUF6887 family protein [Aphanothece sacrum]|uniref:Uncharacterized protein n=1 Tax=Aphanothece sacrum FPU1 TaxID=1920663 RepID=A0A401IHL6_APHSA|nr:hypothetical protein [Aphanothece sacrum]GBF80782.1 hypothetical protein AsFPU1_2187 [Aphanothece sacrum FPU1]GBF83277.1 hypothetical protein AsFPU3_0317 [Aphanothece sacrum FPU3]